MTSRFEQLVDLAAPRYGLCTVKDLLALGYDRDGIKNLVARRRLEKVTARVYRLAGAPLPWQGRILAEQLSVGDKAIVSHRSAACLYGLKDFDAGRVVHLTVPGEARPQPRPDVVIHRASDYGTVGRCVRQRVPVTSVPRLILDLCAAERNLAIPRRALHSARKKNLVTWGGARPLPRNPRQVGPNRYRHLPVAARPVLRQGFSRERF